MTSDFAEAFDPPRDLGRLRDTAPLARMTYPDGHVGWLVTNHDLAKRMLQDPRMSARSELKRPPVSRGSIEPFYGRPALPGWLVDMDAPKHTRLRRQLVAHLTARRMRAWETTISETVAELLDQLAECGPPVDLVRSFCLALPSKMICELLGVPYDLRKRFQRESQVLFSLDATPDSASRAMENLYEVLWQVISDASGTAGGLMRTLREAQILTDEEIVGMGVLLLSAGHESTTSSLALSVATMLRHPEQRHRMVEDPGVVPGAVEELLRYLTVFHLGVPRSPTEDVEYDGVLIRAGESVTIALPSANRDPVWCPGDPDAFDIDRVAPGHLAFGSGIHQCLGQNLVRAEMRVALPELFRRFPDLHLVGRWEEVQFASDVSVYGIHALEVTW